MTGVRGQSTAIWLAAVTGLIHDFSVYYWYYSATIIQMTGVKDQSTAIWLAAVTGLIHDFFCLL